MVHLREHVDRVRVEGEIRSLHNAKGVQLMTKCALSKDKLGSVRPVKTINAVCPAYAILEGDGISDGCASANQ